MDSNNKELENNNQQEQNKEENQTVTIDFDAKELKTQNPFEKKKSERDREVEKIQKKLLENAPPIPLTLEEVQREERRTALRDKIRQKSSMRTPGYVNPALRMVSGKSNAGLSKPSNHAIQERLKKNGLEADKETLNLLRESQLNPNALDMDKITKGIKTTESFNLKEAAEKAKKISQSENKKNKKKNKKNTKTISNQASNILLQASQGEAKQEQ